MRRVSRLLPASGIRHIFDRASAMERQGRRILHLEIGRPDWPMPEGAAEAAAAALAAGQVHYIANRGLIELRRALADRIAARSGRRYDPDAEIVVTTGASEAVAAACLALAGPGDEVVIPEPAWPHYRAAALLAGAEPVRLDLDASDGFLLDPDRLAACLTPRTKLLVINSPGNPTGAVQPRERLQAVARLAEQNGLIVLSDEIYEDFVFEGEHVSLASLLDPQLLVLVGGLSKGFAMTGWRIGHVAAPPDLADAVNRVHQYLTVCGVPFAQRGALAACQAAGDYAERMRREFRRRRAVWLEALAGHPALAAAPGGAFYLFLKVGRPGLSGDDFCERVLTDRGVALVPGRVFGESFADFARVSYGGPLEVQREAAALLRAELDR